MSAQSTAEASIPIKRRHMSSPQRHGLRKQRRAAKVAKERSACQPAPSISAHAIQLPARPQLTTGKGPRQGRAGGPDAATPPDAGFPIQRRLGKLAESRAHRAHLTAGTAWQRAEAKHLATLQYISEQLFTPLAEGSESNLQPSIRKSLPRDSLVDLDATQVPDSSPSNATANSEGWCPESSPPPRSASASLLTARWPPGFEPCGAPPCLPDANPVAQPAAEADATKPPSAQILGGRGPKPPMLHTRLLSELWAFLLLSYARPMGGLDFYVPWHWRGLASFGLFCMQRGSRWRCILLWRREGAREKPFRSPVANLATACH